MNKALIAIALSSIAVLSLPSTAQKPADLDKTIVKDGKTYKYQEGMPYVDRGQMKNGPPPPVKLDPSPAEKVVQKVMESPVKPAIVNGQPGVSYTKKLD